MQVSPQPDDAQGFGRVSEWRLSALCAETDPEAFFPELGGSPRAAKAVCAQCSVRAECLEFAIANDERFGVWGGTTEKERRQLRRRSRSAAESAGSPVNGLWPRPPSRLTTARDADRSVIATPSAVLTRETV
jgi:WhiB family transcriptional regulator, redox-sensing transcriptional regulator